MTIVKAREILGSLAETLSDEQVQAIIDNFSGIIEIGFQLFERNNPKLAATKNKLES